MLIFQHTLGPLKGQKHLRRVVPDEVKLLRRFRNIFRAVLSESSQDSADDRGCLSALSHCKHHIALCDLVLLKLQLSNDLQILEPLQCIDKCPVSARELPDDLVLHPVSIVRADLPPDRRPACLEPVPELLPRFTLNLLGQSARRSTPVYVYLATLRDYSLLHGRSCLSQTRH